jgi:hypothetical protein
MDLPANPMHRAIRDARVVKEGGPRVDPTPDPVHGGVKDGEGVARHPGAEGQGLFRGCGSVSLDQGGEEGHDHLSIFHALLIIQVFFICIGICELGNELLPP